MTELSRADAERIGKALATPRGGALERLAQDEAERIVQAERESAGKGQASVEATPEGLEASASVDVGRRASAGGFIRRTWRGAIEWGAKFKASW